MKAPVTSIHEKIADDLRTGIYSRMSPARKWEEACRLREAAWKLKAAGLRAKYPAWSDIEIDQVVRKIFLYATT